MVDRIDTALVRLWGEDVGAVAWLQDRGYAVFEFERDFLDLGLDISPVSMGLEEARRGNRLFSFPALNSETFMGLPGLLADSLPDKFGNHIIDAWLVRQGRTVDGFSPVERLCYTGQRAMGALEFFPCSVDQANEPRDVELAELVELAQQVMAEKGELSVSLGESGRDKAGALADILRVGTSAGGARPKAVIAVNESGQVVSGQGKVPKGYDYWILKFDGVSDLELGEPSGYGRIEYAYYLMAGAAGIDMTECRLLEENGRAHFMTRRFDRVGGEKLHMQTLCGIAHYDFNMAGAYSYEQAFSVMRKMRLSKLDAQRLYRRMVFNVLARNQDDHTKNISFLLDENGKWRLAPAYDVIYSHNPAGQWTNRHQMSINGKRDEFTLADLIGVGDSISLSRPGEIVDEVADAVSRWVEFAAEAGVSLEAAKEIGENHRLQVIGNLRG